MPDEEFWLRETEIAYAAGIIDGEGCIRVTKMQAKNKVTLSYLPKVQIRMVEEKAIKFIKELFGGSYYKGKAHCPNGRPLYSYCAENRIAVRILRAVLPYLIVKKDSAENAIKCYEFKKTHKLHRVKAVGFREFPNKWGDIRIIPNYALSDSFIARLEEFFQESKRLNLVGLAALERDRQAQKTDS